MEKTKLIRWWKYASFWKVFGFGVGAVVLSLVSALLIPNVWCLFAILPICGVSGYFIKKFIPEMFKDLMKELE